MKKLPLKENLITYTEIAMTINQLIDTLARIDPFINSELGKVEPQDKLDGLLAYANGTDWDPGSGKGLYRWNSTTNNWILVG